MWINPKITACIVLLLALLPSIPTPIAAIKISMLVHMTIQIPTLLYAGYLLANVYHQKPIHHSVWPIALSAWIWVYFTLIFWMLPIHLDKATMFMNWDIFKIMSLLLAGALLSIALKVNLIWGAFFIVSTAIGLIFLGVYYQEAGVRVCSNYLIESQQNTGVALLVWGITLLIVLIYQSKNTLLREH